MVSLIAEDVSLTFPLYDRAARTTGTSSEADRRVVRDRRGRIVGVQALDGISFSLESGDRLALIGHNGAGKTTLLRVLAGIVTPDTGYVGTQGRTANLININLGMQIEASGHRNITLRGLAAGHDRASIDARRGEIAAFSELGSFLDMPLSTYSAGMRMRLSFAIATAFDAEILLLDEWISAGDAAFKEKATARMHAFAERAGILVLATHSHSMMMDNCNKALWLERGRMRAVGPTEEIVEAYQAETQRQARGARPEPGPEATPAPRRTATGA